jgi:hypothetical protein
MQAFEQIISYGSPDNSGEMFSIGLFNNGGSPLFSCYNGGYLVSNYKYLRDSNWHNYIIVYDETLGTELTNYKLYIDGELALNLAFTSGWVKTNTLKKYPLTIGNYFIEKLTGSEFDKIPLKGELDDLGLWDRVLTRSEILYLASQISR